MGIENGYQGKFQVLPDGKITHEFYDIAGGIRRQFVRMVLDTREAHTRDALITLGWTPPADEKRTPEEIWEACEKRERLRAESMPDERTALRAMVEAYQRLQELGFKPAEFCPKDGTIFEVVEAGSTGIHPCHYEGEWPSGRYFIHGYHDLYISRPVLFRPLSEDSQT